MNEVCILDRWEGDTAVIEVTDEADQIRWQQVSRQQLPDAVSYTHLTLPTIRLV